MVSMIDINKQIHQIISEVADIYEMWANKNDFIYDCLFQLETDFLVIMQEDGNQIIRRSGFANNQEGSFISLGMLGQAIINDIESDPVHFQKVFKKRHDLYLLFHYLEVDKNGFLNSVDDQVFLLHNILILSQKLWHLDAGARIGFMQDYKMEYLHAMALIKQEFTMQAEEIEAFLDWEDRLADIKITDQASIVVHNQIKQIFIEVRKQWEGEQSSYLTELYDSIDPSDLQSMLPSRKGSFLERLKEFARTVVCYVYAWK